MKETMAWMQDKLVLTLCLLYHGYIIIYIHIHKIKNSKKSVVTKLKLGELKIPVAVVSLLHVREKQ
jgi:hypothetical protein